MWSKVIRFLAHFSQVRAAKNTTTHNWNFETSALLSLVQLKLNNIAVILSVHQLPPSLSVLVNVISSCDWVFSSFSALPDTLLVIWFVKIISVNTEHFGALAVLALPKTKDPNCCANQKRIYRYSEEQTSLLLFHPLEMTQYQLNVLRSSWAPLKNIVLPYTRTSMIHKSITRQDWNLHNVVIIDWGVWLELVQSISVICQEVHFSTPRRSTTTILTKWMFACRARCGLFIKMSYLCLLTLAPFSFLSIYGIENGWKFKMVYH